MKKFLLRIFIFTLPIIILMYCADIYVSDGLEDSSLNYGEIATWRDIYSGKLNSECWIRGSSKAWVQLSPEIIERKTGICTYNIGIDAYRFDFQQFRYEQALKYNTKPSLILYSVDAFLLGKSHELVNASQFLPFMLWNKPLEKATRAMDGYNSADYIIPFWRYRGSYKEIKEGIMNHFRSNEAYRYKGYKGFDLAWNDDFSKAKMNIDSYHTEIDSVIKSSFEDFIRISKSEDIKVILVYAPEYIEGQKFIDNRSDVIDIYRTLSSKYNIPYLDYSKDSMCYNRGYYYNSMHLNEKGSKLFTEKLVIDMRNSGLLNY